MRKILAIVLLVCMMFSSVMVDATETQVTQNQDYTKVLHIFEYLDAFNGQSSDEIDTAKVISRAEFVSICVNVLDMQTENGETIFYDVTQESVYFDAVSYLVQAGILSVGTDRMFRPNEGILYSEALKILLSLAGYDEYVAENGGFPIGYLYAAKRFGIDVEKGADDTLSYGEALELMFQVMTMGVYDLYTIGEEEKRYTVSLESTLLSVHRDLYVNQGTVETTETFSMTENTCEKQEALINGVKYQLHQNLNLTGFEGNYVEFVYEKSSTDNTLIYLECIDNDRDISIVAKEYINFDPNSYTLTYYDNLETWHIASAKIDKKWTIVYNGRKYKGTLQDALKGFSTGERKGTIEIKKNPERQDAVVIIRNYRRYVVGSYDLNKQILFNKFVTNDPIKLGDYANYSIRKRNGEVVKEEEIIPEIALLVAESADKSFLDILIPEKKVDLVAQSIRAENIIEFGEEEFVVDAMEWKRIQNTIDLGALYSCWIDAFGEIAYMTLAKNHNFSLGFIAATSVQKSFGAPLIDVKMLTEDGTLKVLRFANRVTVDGAAYQGKNLVRALFAIPETENMSGFDESYAMSRMESIRLQKQLIRYRLNSEGEINCIDTYYVNKDGGETEETSLTKHKKRSLTYRYRLPAKSARFDKDILYSSTSTKVFNVPWTDKDGYMIDNGGLINGPTALDATLSYQLDDNGGKKLEKDDMYSIGVGVAFNDYQYYNIDAYNYDGNNPYTDVIVHYDDFIGNGLYAQVCEIICTMDEKGNQGYGVMVVNDKGEQLEYFTTLESEVEGLNVGDIIYGVTYGNKIYHISKKFDCQTREFVGSTSEFDYWYDTDYNNSQKQFSKGIVTKSQDGCVFLKYDMQNTDTKYDEAVDLSSVGFTVYERDRSDKPTVEIGTIDRITEYSSAGTEASYIVIRSSLAQPKYAYIFNGR